MRTSADSPGQGSGVGGDAAHDDAGSFCASKLLARLVVLLPQYRYWLYIHHESNHQGLRLGGALVTQEVLLFFDLV